MRLRLALLGALVLFGTPRVRSRDCSEFRECALGSIYTEVVNFHAASADLDHPLMKALCRYRASDECKDTALETKKKEHCPPNEVHGYGAQCTSRFSFTNAEAVLAHLFLVLNTAIGVSYAQDYP